MKMKIKIFYLLNDVTNYQVESFNNDTIDFKFVSNFDDLILMNKRGLVDVILFDEDFTIDEENIFGLINNLENKINVYFLIKNFSIETVQWAMNQSWIDKVIPVSNENFAINNNVIEVISKDTKLLMENNQLLQDNRELEFVISQMMLVD